MQPRQDTMFLYGRGLLEARLNKALSTSQLIKLE